MGIATVSGVREDRDTFRRALEISLLVHLLLIFLLIPELGRVWARRAKVADALTLKPKAREEKPLQFELVDLPDQKKEKPPDTPVPLSDMDRRAHGGEGKQRAPKPASRGNTPNLIRSQGGRRFERGAPPQRQGPPQKTIPQPVQRKPVPEPEESKPEENPKEMVMKEGVGEKGKPRAAPQKPAIKLPPPGSWAMPPDVGGLEQNPDRRGGRADTGTLSFDTRWYDWGPYAAEMLRKIRRHWRIPEIAMLGAKGVVKIRFYIERDGTVTGLRIVDESGKPPMDFSARDAIATSSPFKALPSDLTGVEREGVTITFFYNTNPDDWGD